VNNKELSSLNPATFKEVGRVKVIPDSQVKAIVKKAWAAFPDWRERGLKERTAILKNVQQQLLSRSEEFASLITREMGKPVHESLGLEVHSCIDIIGYYVRNAETFLGDKRVPLHHILFKRRGSWLHFEPLGVLGIISPWNWPLLIPINSVVPALLSGNAVVFKHSEWTPILAEKMRDLFIESGIPEDVFQIIQGGAKPGKALVESSVAKIFFTGSTKVGKIIYNSAAKQLKKCVLEMGGSDAAVVCKDADVEYAASGIVWGGFSNCGQNCNAIERVFIHQDIFDVFLKKLINKIKKLRLGNGEAEDSDIGPLVSQEQLDKIKHIVEQSRKAGDTIVTGGIPLHNSKGYFFQPTVIVRDASRIQEDMEEVFGPVIYLTSVANDDEAVQLANRSKYGLTASVWTCHKKRGQQIARRLHTGTVMINDVIVSFGMAEAGWTGVKQSGIGWVHGEKGLDEMVNIKYINYEPQNHIQKFWWFPYSQKMITTLRSALQFLFSASYIRRIANVLPVLKRMSAFLLLNKKRSDKL